MDQRFAVLKYYYYHLIVNIIIQLILILLSRVYPLEKPSNRDSNFNSKYEQQLLEVLPAAIRRSLSAGVKCENLHAAPYLHSPTTMKHEPG